LALATSDNPAEAEAALAKAQLLMEENNIRSIDIDVDTGEANIATEVVRGSTTQQVFWETQLAAGIAHCFDARAITQKIAAGGWRVTFVASASELAIITDLFKRVRRTVSKMGTEFCLWNRHLGSSKTVRHNYCAGMVTTVHNRLRQIYVDTPETRALVLVKEGAIEKHIDNIFGSVKKRTCTTTLKNREAYMRGEQDGHRVQLHKGVNGGSTYQLQSNA
jgi:hypothetical protein